MHIAPKPPALREINAAGNGVIVARLVGGARVQPNELHEIEWTRIDIDSHAENDFREGPFAPKRVAIRTTAIRAVVIVTENGGAWEWGHFF
jgi:hypothetical protein